MRSGGYPLLTRVEEDAYARRARKGDQLAKEKLINANLRFVVKIAKQFHSDGFPLEDLINEGNIGLMNAVEHFDPSKGYRLISYAVWWIRQAILRAISERSRMIHLPRDKALRLLRVMQAREDLGSGRRMESRVEAQSPHAERENVTELLDISRELLSLEAPFGSVDGISRLEDFVEDKKNSRPEDILVESSLRDEVSVVLGSLSQKESEVLQYRFGLNGKRRMTLKTLGRKYDLTLERVRQIEKKAIEHLRHPSCANPLSAYR